ncbi:MAG: uracil-DNA glycosylase [Anabaena sp. 49633_E8]|nr:uracil-DNA glycosylase [Anabaena sp. 49633_E8]
MQHETQLSLFDNSSLNQKELITTSNKIPIPPGTYENVEELTKHCNGCQRCALSENRTHAVVGRGNLQAEIMIIGEAPGKNEDETGLPFDPKIILLTGATSVKGVIGDKRPITKIRGQWLEWEGRLCMPIFHPSYLLRNPSREQGKPKWLMWQDIQVVRAKFDEFKNQDQN